MSARSKSRKRALDILFAADARGVDPLEVLSERLELTRNPSLGGSPAQVTPLGDYAEELVRGVAQHRDRLDEVIAGHARGWSLDRMPAVDRVVLRMAAFELLYVPDVPPAVAIDEAVELAKTLSTDDSPRFVNGVLGQLVPDVGQLRAQNSA
ncbi:transcription antitermination factor NusB [Nakamurella leprariae]|uniref:Transcription antitermination protein NusB n=1 Tax=Nakamurella leprariae TaxID=2803911 RepID=A0A938Y9C7_9ACTN|nr:transcription antitermination factor NusB [Nakamurella leprariae]MBM9468255.1 transcription antitermination factor NusB [Nakamurella leprariae]